MKKNHRSTHVFVRRMTFSVLLGVSLIVAALMIGTLGYHYFESMAWEDAFVNAAMILSGMGPMGILNTTSGKMFAAFYALFSGLLFILVVGIIFAPVAHRFFKKWHIEDGGAN